jgi:hypothetical protein
MHCTDQPTAGRRCCTQRQRGGQTVCVQAISHSHHHEAGQPHAHTQTHTHTHFSTNKYLATNVAALRRAASSRYAVVHQELHEGAAPGRTNNSRSTSQNAGSVRPVPSDGSKMTRMQACSLARLYARPHAHAPQVRCTHGDMLKAKPWPALSRQLLPKSWKPCRWPRSSRWWWPTS